MAIADTKVLRRWQQHLESKLLSEPLLNKVAIALMLNQVRLSPENRKIPHVAGRTQTVDGKPVTYVGSGITINLPDAIPSKDSDVSGVQMDPVIWIDIFNEDNIALVSDIGSGITAEEILYIVWMMVHQYLDKDISSGNAYVVDFTPIQDKQGAYGYRLGVACRMAQDEPNKCAAPIVTFADGQATITCATEGATIYYTTDESYPGPYTPNEDDPANTSTVYDGPFAVASGTIICVTAFIPNSTTTLGSDLWTFTAP